MYIRTPKKYRGRQRRSLISWRRIILSLLMIVVIVGGMAVYQNRETVQPQIMQIVATAAVEMQGGMATLQAPPPTATPDPAANLTRADNAWVVGDIATALEAYREIVSAVPNDGDIYYRVTMSLLTNGDENEALSYAERTITADPFSADSWAARALALVENERPAEGITSALQALDIDEDNVSAMAFLSLAYFRVDLDATAFSWAERAINANPDRFEGYYARGILYENSLAYLNPDLAGADYRTAYGLALEQNPALAGDVAVGIARVQGREALTTQDYTPAINTLQEVLQFNPTNVDALTYMGSIQYGGEGDFNEALTYYQSCIDVDPNNQECIYRAGRAHNAVGNATEALEHFLRLVDDMGSTNGYHYYWAGQLHLDLGGCDSAARYWSRGYDYVINGPQASDNVLISSYEALPDCAGLNFSNAATVDETPINNG